MHWVDCLCLGFVYFSTLWFVCCCYLCYNCWFGLWFYLCFDFCDSCLLICFAFGFSVCVLLLSIRLCVVCVLFCLAFRKLFVIVIVLVPLFLLFIDVGLRFRLLVKYGLVLVWCLLFYWLVSNLTCSCLGVFVYVVFWILLIWVLLVSCNVDFCLCLSNDWLGWNLSLVVFVVFCLRAVGVFSVRVVVGWAGCFCFVSVIWMSLCCY